MRWIAAALLLCACHKNELTADSYPAELARAVCVPQSKCRDAAAYVEQDCEQEILGGFVPDLGKAVKAGKLKFDSNSAQACVDGLMARGCDPEPQAVTAACSQALQGTVAAGGACNWLYECDGTYCEAQKAGQCPSTCTAPIAKGGACGDTGQCDRRLALRCIDSVCSDLHAAGEACTSNSDCANTLFCDQAASKCAARVNELAVCNDDSECAAGLFCRLTSAGGLCEKEAATGAPCGQDGDHVESVRSQCAPGFVCKGFVSQKGTQQAGACTAAGQVNDTCVVGATIPGCAEGLICGSNGRCAVAPATGPCQTDADCEPESHYCDGAQCQPVEDVGATCTRKEECASRYCDLNVGQCAELPDLACHEP